MKTVNLNSVTLKKNGTPVVLMGVTDKEKEWELLNDITFTENTPFVQIDSDQNGVAYNLDALAVIITVGTVTGVKGNLDVYALEHGHWQKPYRRFIYSASFSSDKVVSGLIMNYKGRQFSYGTYLESNWSFATPYVSTPSVLSRSWSNVTLLSIDSGGDGLPSGTNIKIYGIRA